MKSALKNAREGAVVTKHSGATQKSIGLPEGVYMKGIGNGIGALQSLPLSFTTIAGTTDDLVASIIAKCECHSLRWTHFQKPLF
jgi:hypothetical protein